jgi:hypothetical protein
MSAETSYAILLEGLKEDRLSVSEAKKILNEIAGALNDDQIEEAEDLISEKEHKKVLERIAYYDSFPVDSSWFGAEIEDSHASFYDWFDQYDE